MARLTLETFPKSGSAFTAASLKLSFPNDEVIWGYQQRTNLKTANNCITIIRDPRDAAPSCMVFFGGKYNDANQVLNWYCRFMDWTYLYRNRIFVSTFEQITSDPMSVIKPYANKFNLEYCYNSVDEIKKFTKETHPLHLPLPKTQERLEADQKVLESDLLENALYLYNRVKDTLV